jgi:SpoVK/Ycf46/Vps4 family AAA+-type ATPase
METQVLENKQEMINDDKEYLESYFKVCELFYEKKQKLAKLKSLKKKKKKNGEKPIAYIKDKLNSLNEAIKQQDCLFWDKVQKSNDSGVKLALEKFSSNYKLSLYEKRALVFFLYLEFYHLTENACPPSDLIELFDLDDSLFNRMRDLKYFSSKAVLIKEFFLVKAQVRHIAASTKNLELTSKAIDLITDLLNGDEKALGAPAQEDCFYLSDEVGHVKKAEYNIDDVMLNDEIKDKVMFLLKASSSKNMEDLGLSQKIKKGKGLAFLFYGPPGTGKSMLAEAIAAYLNKKILIVEFPKITSRWYGETDKQIANIFKNAKLDNLVICMDEADSLLYNRSYAAQEHDIRFVNVMLQEIERYEGEIILTTNMDTLLDPALERRVALKVKFELPDKALREKIWLSHIPDKVTISEDVNFAFLADQYELSGGYIKNAVFHALRRLANDNRSKLIMDDLIFGANMEKDGMFIKDNKQKIGFFANA